MEKHVGRTLTRREVVHHKKDITDNKIESLELMSLSEHSRMHRLGAKMSEASKAKLRMVPRYYGQGHPCSKLSNENVCEIRNRIALGQTERSIASKFGVGKTTIHDIKIGATWAK
jgi:hypothetical protein